MSDKKYNLAIAKDINDKKLTQVEWSWDEIIAKLKTPAKTHETVEQYKKLDKDAKTAIKDCGGFIAGVLNGGSRKINDVLSRDLVVLDADFATPSTEHDIDRIIEYDALIYSTHKSTPEKPRFRVVVPLSRSVTPAEYEPLARKIAEQFGMDLFDEASYRINQLMFFPSVSSDGVYIFRVYDKGKVCNPDEILAKYDDYLNVEEYPISSRENPKQNYDKDKVEDPLNKQNIIGAFCNTYTMTDAINTFLADIYRPTRKPDRFDFIPADAKNGVQVFDNKFLYSHHTTDPASMKLLNAFDVVRIHKFGHLDKNDDKEKQVSRLKSYKKMCEFVSNDIKVKENLLKLKSDSGSFECDDWVSKLKLDKKTNGLLPSLENCEYILANDENLKSIRFNAFVEQYFVDDVPWKMEKPPTWTNSDEDQLISYLSRKYVLFSDRIIKIAFTKIGHDRMYHPVKEYFESLPEWDKVPRLDKLFIDYLGADDNIYVREATRKTIVAAVSRIYNPGIKFDEVLVLSGDQGIGKSTIFSRLAKDWFSDSLSMNDMKDKTAAEKLQGFLLLEMAELSGMKKIEIETLKGFITRQDDKFRPAYGRVVESHKRQCVIVGTTNKEEFLRDVTGNRRFWCITCKPADKKPWQLTDDDVDQIWAEALVRYKANETFKLSKEAEVIALNVQKDSIEEDGREGMVEEYLNMPLPNDWDNLTLEERKQKIDAYQKHSGEVAEWKGKRTTVTNQEIWAECFRKDLASIKNSDIFSIKSIMQKIGGWKRMNVSRRFTIYGKQRFYERCD